MTGMTFNAALEGQRLRAYQVTLIAVILLVLVIDGIDIQLVSLVAPVILREWGIDRAAFGPAMAGALIGMAAGVGAGGWLADRFGRRRTLVYAVLLFGAATIAAGFTHDIAGLTALRALSGFGFGAAGPAGLALGTEWLPGRLRPHVIALLSIGTPAGGMVGASLVLLILPVHGWQATFFLCGLLTLMIGLLGAAVVRESPPYLLAHGQQAEAERAATRVLHTPVALVAEAEEAPGAGPGGSAPRLFDAVHRRLIWGSGISFFCAAAVSYAFSAWTPVLLTARGFTLEQALGASFVYSLASMLGALSAGFANRALGSRRVLVIAALSLLACLIALALLIERGTGAPDDGGRAVINLLIGGAGAFVSLAIATIYTMMTFGFPAACRASGIGLGMLMGRFGGISTALAGGYLLNAGGAAFWPFFGVLILAAGLVCLGAFLADRHLPSARAQKAG